MTLSITPFDPVGASEKALADFYQLFLADTRLERPEDREPTRASAVGRLRTPLTAVSQSMYWAAFTEGRLVGLLTACLPEHENTQQALVELRVHPDSRRRGIGTALLRTMLPVVIEKERTLLVGRGVRDGGAGFHFASHLGFRVVHSIVLQELALTPADPSRWEVPAPTGYSLARWVGSAPTDLLASYARARAAIHDAPTGESFRPPGWTPERIRHAESTLRERNVEQRIVAALHEESGSTVGLTEIQLHPHRTDLAFQQDTAVLTEHRGQGLGRWIKAHMTTWLRTERPALTHIRTTTAADNVHMIRVNTELGYAIVRRMVTVEADARALCDRLG
jgi:GNAT superfamily N-acetyltransferase